MINSQNFFKVSLTSVLLSCSFFLYSQVTSITNGLVGEWTFNNGNANADYGGIDGTVYNATTATDRFGCPNHAYKFEKADTSSIDLGDSFDSITSTEDSAWSISLWFKLDDLNNSWAPMFNKYSASNCGVSHQQYIIRLTPDNKIQFCAFFGLTYQNTIKIEGATTINDQKWHHLVINYDGSIDSNNGHDRVTVFLDNQQETTTLTEFSGSLTNISDGDAHLGIGARLNENGNYCYSVNTSTHHLWDGVLDDYRLYNRVLTFSDIDSLFNENRSCESNNIVSKTSRSFEVKFYPNPTKEILVLDIDQSKFNFELDIFDLYGRKMMHFNIDSKRVHLNLSELESGTYIFKLNNKSSDDTIIKRIVKSS